MVCGVSNPVTSTRAHESLGEATAVGRGQKVMEGINGEKRGMILTCESRCLAEGELKAGRFT